MCGIVVVIDKYRKVGDLVLNQFFEQSHRGTQGFGLISVNSAGAKLTKTPYQSEAIRSVFKLNSKAMIFHHRLPSSTSNTTRGAHPYSVTIGNKTYHTIHNGIIHNAEELYQQMKKRHTFESVEVGYFKTVTVNDSEVLAVDMAELLARKNTAMESRGWLAVVTLITDKQMRPLEMVFGTHNAPLNLLKTSKRLMLSSEGPGVALDDNVLFRYNWTTGGLTIDRNFPWPPLPNARQWWEKEEPKQTDQERLDELGVEIALLESDHGDDPAKLRRLRALENEFEDLQWRVYNVAMSNEEGGGD